MRARAAERISSSSLSTAAGAVAEVAEKEVGGVFRRHPGSRAFPARPQSSRGAPCGAEQRRLPPPSRRPSPSSAPGRSLSRRRGPRKARGQAAKEQHRRAPRKRHAQRQHQPAARDERIGGKQRPRSKAPARAMSLWPRGSGVRRGRRGAETEAGGQRRAPPRRHRATSRQCRAPPGMFLRRRHGLPGYGLLAPGAARRLIACTCSRTAAREASSMRG